MINFSRENGLGITFVSFIQNLLRGRRVEAAVVHVPRGTQKNRLLVLEINAFWSVTSKEKCLGFESMLRMLCIMLLLLTLFSVPKDSPT